jgi:hypothetical protein
MRYFSSPGNQYSIAYWINYRKYYHHKIGVRVRKLKADVDCCISFDLSRGSGVERD